MKIKLLLMIAALAAISAPAFAASPAVFEIGAAVADLTPPPFDPQSHTPAIDPPGFDGARQWDFTEPYVDLDGNGYWDPGEPYADENHNGRYDGICLAGGGGRISQPPTAVGDPITARTFVVDNGVKRIAIVVLDTIGAFNVDLDRIRAAARAQLPDGALDEIFISSTHDESAPDVIGLWGPGAVAAVGSGIGNSGVDDYWMDFMTQRAAQAIVDAYHARVPAFVKLAETTQPENFLTCWSSYPYVRASKVPVMQAVAKSGGRVIFTLINYGIHAETLGFNPDTGSGAADQKYWLSADWPFWARQALEARYGGVGIQMAGAVGSVETPKIFPGGFVAPVPTGQYDAGHPAGCRTIFATSGTAMPVGYFDETRAVGEGVAARAIAALDNTGQFSASNTIAFARKKFLVPVTNALFNAASAGQTFPHRPFYVDGVEVQTASAVAADPTTLLDEPAPAPDAGGQLQVQTEAAVYRIGDAEFITTPGEHFPIGLIRGFQGPDDMPFPSDPMSDFVLAYAGGKYRFIEGLGEDMIGYLFPKANSVGVPGDRPISDVSSGFSSGDRFDCGHSDDSEATSGDAGDIVSAVLVSILRDLDGAAGAVVGRYIWPDLSLHRNPLGDGTLGCTPPFRSFVAAPGAPLGVEIRDGTGVKVIALPGANLVHDGVARGFVDYNGSPQGKTPTVDTRGVQLRDGTLLFVDVYPDVSLPPPLPGP